MKQQERSEGTGQEKLRQAKKKKSDAVMHAGLIGLMIGIIIYSVAKDTVGLVTLIPLFFIYKLMNRAKDDQAPQEE